MLLYNSITPIQFFARNRQLDEEMRKWSIAYDVIDRTENKTEKIKRTAHSLKKSGILTYNTVTGEEVYVQTEERYFISSLPMGIEEIPREVRGHWMAELLQAFGHDILRELGNKALSLKKNSLKSEQIWKNISSQLRSRNFLEKYEFCREAYSCVCYG